MKLSTFSGLGHREYIDLNLEGLQLAANINLKSQP